MGQPINVIIASYFSDKTGLFINVKIKVSFVGFQFYLHTGHITGEQVLQYYDRANHGESTVVILC